MLHQRGDGDTAVQRSYLYGEDARYSDGTADPFQAQGGHLGVIAVLKPHAESGQEGRPRQLRE